MKRKALATALMAGLAGTMGISSMTNAVNVNPDGTGQVLLYPYYTVRNDFDTLISVINTTDEAKAVKVRFLEGKASQEVLDFNLYLSEFDVWTAAITDDGVTGRLFTNDNTCTVPTIPANGVQFRNFQYSNASQLGVDGDPTDAAADGTIDRAREGYIEMIEMGVVTDATFGSASAATHGANGVPASCAQLNTAWALGGANNYWRDDASADMDDPIGGIFGDSILVDVESGSGFGVDATAIDGFSVIELHEAPGSLFPNLNQANTREELGGGEDDIVDAFVFDNGQLIVSQFDTSGIGSQRVDAVSAVLMREQVFSEYIIDPNLGAATDWVITFPTKSFYVESDGSDVDLPFTNVLGSGGACEPIDLGLYDREEQEPGIGGIDFSPLPPGPEGPALCWEANVVSFYDVADPNPVGAGGSTILGSEQVASIAVPFSTQQFVTPAGWANIGFTNADTSQFLDSDQEDDMNGGDATDTGDRYFGLPTIGFTVETFVNANAVDTDGDGIADVSANYAVAFAQKGDIRVQD